MTQTKPELWDSVDAKAWRDFLGTQTGRHLLELLAQEEPELMAKGDINEILIRSGELRHHKDIVSLLLFLVGDVVEEQQSQVSLAYPPLDDDKYWEGDKLNK